MYLSSPHQSEIRISLEAMTAMVNQVVAEEPAFRPTLAEAGFSRAEGASDDSFAQLERRFQAITPMLAKLAEADQSVEEAAAWLNRELAQLALSPSVADHDGVGPHLHWTPESATFDDQVVADLLMALAQELCDNGLDRFGCCAADDCQRLFYDSTRNNSRRFCSDPRCASRTHTASHRARRRAVG